MQIHFFIDGYNVLHALSGRRGTEESLESGREKLLFAIKNSALYPRHKFTIVFDGATDVYPQNGKQRQGRLSVIFSRPPVDADTLILQICSRAKNPEGIEVVSSDKEHIVKKAECLGIKTSSAGAFIERLQNKRKKSLKVSQEKPEPSAADAEYWSRIFNGS